MATYVLVHGAWHTGKELEPTAAPIRAAGHEVHIPTLAGNRPGDSKKTGLDEAIKSIVDYLAQNNLRDIILVGHSYGGMIITGVADRAADRIRRLVYWNAFVPNNGESLNDMVPPPYVELFNQIAAQRGDGSVVLPFPIWREAFINDADAELARATCRSANPTSTAPRTPRCRTTIPGIRGCRRSSGCSGWFRCRGVMSCASPIRSFWRMRSCGRDGTKNFHAADMSCPRIAVIRTASFFRMMSRASRS
jgi:pimeloyl-ACP methyl ester carboxylesterase